MLVYDATAVLRSVRGRFTSVHPSPVLVVGNQKSGTTVIAALLSKLTGMPATLDLFRESRESVVPQVLDGRMSLERLIRRNRLDFSRPIVKEPALTLLYDQLADRFAGSRFVMVVRDPRDNVRSILNRLGIPGDLEDLQADAYARLTPSWRLNVDNRWLGLPAGNYVEMLAHRWNHMIDLYERHTDRSILCRYEAFMQDKAGEIRSLASALGAPELNSIDGSVDVQYQHAGDRQIGWPAFFGRRNLARIEEICAERMHRFFYG